MKVAVRPPKSALIRVVRVVRGSIDSTSGVAELKRPKAGDQAYCFTFAGTCLLGAGLV